MIEECVEVKLNKLKQLAELLSDEELYEIVSALRGVDIEDEVLTASLKEIFTARIRYYTMLYPRGLKYPEGTLVTLTFRLHKDFRFSELINVITSNLSNATHFIDHVVDALKNLRNIYSEVGDMKACKELAELTELAIIVKELAYDDLFNDEINMVKHMEALVSFLQEHSHLVYGDY